MLVRYHINNIFGLLVFSHWFSSAVKRNLRLSLKLRKTARVDVCAHSLKSEYSNQLITFLPCSIKYRDFSVP